MNRKIKLDSRSIALAMSLMMFSLAACGGAASTVAPTSAPTAAPAATAVPPTDAPAPTVAPTAEPTLAPTEAPAAAPTATAAPTEAPTATAAPTEAPAAVVVFKIDGARSKATFTLDEKLFGQPKTVVGETSGVQGEISFSPADLSQTKVGTLQIDASTLSTDSGNRNRAIARFILQTTLEQYKYITFEPTAIEGLPPSAKVGEALSFKITGNLKVRDVVKPVTFDTTATLVSDTELSGSAVATVLRSDFGLQIPSVPSVADVTDAVKLQLDFVAVP
jgi:polyisoprenoid-binding protein YceI